MSSRSAALVLGEDGGAGNDVRAAGVQQLFHRAQALAGGDDVVHDGDALAAQQTRVGAVKAQGLGLLAS